MAFEATNIVASVLKSVQPDRSLEASQRVAGIAQDQLAEQGEIQAEMRKADGSDKSERSRLKRDEKEGGRKRRQQQQQHLRPLPPDDQEHLIDTVA